MSRRFKCPHPAYNDCWIEIPDEFLGIHAQRRDEVIAGIPEGTGVTQSNFMVAVSLLDDWNMPGMIGQNPEKWEFEKMSLNIIAWISNVTLTEYGKCFVLKKNS